MSTGFNRIKGLLEFAQGPKASRVVSNILVEAQDVAEVIATSSFCVGEWRPRTRFSGSDARVTRSHALNQDGKILEKKVQLLNADAPLQNMTFLFKSPGDIAKLLVKSGGICRIKKIQRLAGMSWLRGSTQTTSKRAMDFSHPSSWVRPGVTVYS